MPQTTKKAKGRAAEAETPGDDQRKFERTPSGWASLWTREFEAANKELEQWLRQAKEVEKVYIDDRKDSELVSEKRTNMFTADTIDTECLLYGRVPQTDVTRKYQDANDDAGRVAAMIMQRVLNGDIERPNDRFARFAGYCLSDHLRANFGLLRWRYDFKTKKIPAAPAVQRPDPQTGQLAEVVPAVEAHEEITWEDVIAEYCHWRDVRWSPCRVWEDCRWIAFRVPMTRQELEDRFPKEGPRVTMNSKRYKDDENSSTGDGPRFPWDRADVWEVWSKEHAQVFWRVDGHNRILDRKPDPLGLQDFWPCPRPMVDWITTTRFVPKPAYLIAQDIYSSVESLTTRIDMLVQALRVVGFYDENMEELQELFESTDENTMIPVKNFAATVASNGGIDGAISWFPLEQVVQTIEQLVQQRDRERELLEQITGRADVQRGQLTNANETATATKAKTKFASKRVQRKQDMFAEFVSDAQRIRAEIISKHFQDDTLRTRSNIDMTEDAQENPQVVEDAIKIIRDEGVEGYRITVKSESLSLPDFAEMQETGTEFMTAMSTVIGAMTKLPPTAMTLLPELAVTLKWYATRFRGTVEVESAMDRLAKKLQKLADQPPQQPGQDDSKVQAQQLKNQGDQQRIQLEGQARSQEIQEETQAEMAKQKAQLEADLQLKAFELEHKARADADAQQRDLHADAQRHAMDLRQGDVEHRRQMEAGAVESHRQEQHEVQTHERQVQLEQQKQKAATQQLRMKGQQATTQARLKAKAQKKPGGK